MKHTIQIISILSAAAMTLTACGKSDKNKDSNAAQDTLEESIIRRHNLVRLEDVEEPQDEGDLAGDEVWSD